MCFFTLPNPRQATHSKLIWTYLSLSFYAYLIPGANVTVYTV